VIEAAGFYRALGDAGVRLFVGVPDSLLSELCAHIHAVAPRGQHVIAANEGGAVAAAAGHYLATGRPAVVYLQNSGLGNAVNPICSLATPEVGGVPMLLLVGWRGEPGSADEPQHALQGRITLPLLSLLGVPAEILPREPPAAAETIAALVQTAMTRRTPVAAIVRERSFASQHRDSRATPAEPKTTTLAREHAIEIVVSCLPGDAVVVSTTGMTSRELYELRERAGLSHGRDYLAVGAMGHASQIAMGIALGRPASRVVCLDGDGAALMHMGSLAVIATAGAANLTHVVLNNGAHDSVGGQPTAGTTLSFAELATACGYACAARVADERGLRHALSEALAAPGPALVEICVRCGSRPDLGRPGQSPHQNVTDMRRCLD
jgi:phosphonopyruvate decarboxylase